MKGNNERNSTKSRFRPIHYLGSKLRILDFIEDTIDSIDPCQGRVCDLFSGSGTVSRHLGFKRSVTAVDIQEYSRVLCSAVLKTPNIKFSGDEFVKRVETSNTYQTIIEVFSPILEYEVSATNSATLGEVDELYKIVEEGSLYIAAENPKSDSQLSIALNKTIANLTENNLSTSKKTMVTQYFGGLYFSYEQATWIDATLECVFSETFDGSPTRDVLMAATIGAISDIVNTVGKQFAQPMRVYNADGSHKRNLLRKILTDRSLSFKASLINWINTYIELSPTPFSNHEVLRMDYCDALKSLQNKDVSVVYADPPYTRYHYSRYYHVLETICLRDMPRVSTTFPNDKQLSRALYRVGRHQSPFCIKSRAGEAFVELFAGVSKLGVPLVLSYSPFAEKSKSTPRMQTIKQLVELAKMFYYSVDVLSSGHFIHSKLNSADRNYQALNEAEMLIVCQNVK
jgi:adenine-specific DNA methylase